MRGITIRINESIKGLLEKPSSPLYQLIETFFYATLKYEAINSPITQKNPPMNRSLNPPF